MQHIHQGISVIDPDLALIAWNKPYQQMFDYPDQVLKAGVSIRELLKFNIERGLLGPVNDIESEVDKRVAYLQRGSSYKYIRKQGEKVIELNGSPLPGGGFVTTYSDISEYMRIQQQLEESKSQLETRVEQRTQELAIAKRQADDANEIKSRFLAAAGHDLMQPFNAATLFASMLAQKADNPQMAEISQGLIQSLSSAEELLNMLLDMTRLESGALTARNQTFQLDTILAPLCTEFSIIAQQKKLKLDYIQTQAQVHSDPRLLKRIVQNLLSNAIRYTQQGRIVVGARRRGLTLEVQVHDTGIGIAAHQQQEIFREFHQLDTPSAQQGLGLGLTIVDRISRLLQHKVELSSKPGAGTCFKITLPRVAHQQPLPPRARSEFSLAEKTSSEPPFLSHIKILVLENDPQIQQAMTTLLQSWGAQVIMARDSQSALTESTDKADIMLLDYHLDQGKNGLEEGKAIQQHCQHPIPAIVTSADRSDELRQQVVDNQYQYLSKPIKPLALKRMIKTLLKQR